MILRQLQTLFRARAVVYIALSHLEVVNTPSTILYLQYAHRIELSQLLGDPPKLMVLWVSVLIAPLSTMSHQMIVSLISNYKRSRILSHQSTFI